jgi:hypothetical protein
MAQEGETETEIFALNPQKNDGKCYEYAEYTREEEINESPFARYFTNKRPVYLGRVINVRTGIVGGETTRTDTFVDHKDKETDIIQNDKTCYREVSCIDHSALMPLAGAAIHSSLTVPTANLIGSYITDANLPLSEIQRVAYIKGRPPGNTNIKTAGKRSRKSRKNKSRKRRNKNKKGRKSRNKK